MNAQAPLLPSERVAQTDAAIEARGSTPAPNNVGQTVVAIIPQDLDTAWRFANIIVKGGMAPKDMQTAEKVFAAVMMGAEVGLSPMQAMQNIAVVNGRTTIWGDAQLGLVEASGKLEDFEERFEGQEGTDTFKAVCRAKRQGRASEIVREFSVADAKKAGLWAKAGPWTQHPKRMLQMRARAQALRDGFADVLRGLYAREEMIGESIIDVTPAGNMASAAELSATYLKPGTGAPTPTSPLTDTAFEDAVRQAEVEQSGTQTHDPETGELFPTNGANAPVTINQ